MDVRDECPLRSETERLRLACIARACGPTCAVVALGDSITYGWGLPSLSSYPAKLERLLNEGAIRAGLWRVINAGVPGDTILCAEGRYERDVACCQADVLLIGLGLNDAALRRTDIDALRERLWLARRNRWVRWGLRVERVLRRVGVRPGRRGDLHRMAPRVRPELYTAALVGLARRARGNGLRVYLLSLPPLEWDRIAAGQAAWYRLYDALIQQAAQASDVPWIDVSQPPPAVPGVRYWQEDGMHLTAQGQAWLAQCIGVRLRRDAGDWGLAQTDDGEMAEGRQ